MKPIFTTMIKQYGAEQTVFKTKTEWENFVAQNSDKYSAKEKTAFSIVSQNFEALSKMDDQEGLALSDFTLMDDYVGNHQLTVQEILPNPHDGHKTTETIDDADIYRAIDLTDICDADQYEKMINNDDCIAKTTMKNLGFYISAPCGASLDERIAASRLVRDEEKYNQALEDQFVIISSSDGEQKLTRFDLLMADLAAYKKP